ncbi:MAG: hypothetical protein RJA70_349 [Pseudomonadota bacterium]|jgi:penicillin-insensitive murein endopeptidase
MFARPYWLLLLALFLTSTASSEPSRKLPVKYKRAPFALQSLSVGAPNDGYQVRARRLRSSTQLKVKRDSQDRNYGHPALVLMLQRSAADLAKAAPNSIMLVGDLSYKGGGPISKHRSHQSGRDADVGFYVRNSKGDAVKIDSFVHIDANGKVVGMKDAYFDEWRNWMLVRSWMKDQRAGIQHVFVASHVRKRLLDYARSNQAQARHYADAAAFLKQPSNSSVHDDHYHVRISCPENQRDICVQEAVSD